MLHKNKERSEKNRGFIIVLYFEKEENCKFYLVEIIRNILFVPPVSFNVSRFTTHVRVRQRKSTTEIKVRSYDLHKCFMDYFLFLPGTRCLPVCGHSKRCDWRRGASQTYCSSVRHSVV